MTFTTFKDFFTSFVGSYSPTGDTISNMDWEWIAGSVLLILLLVTFFKSLRFIFRGVGK